MPGLPSLWLAGGLGACLLLFLGGNAIKHKVQLDAAQRTGEATGAGRVTAKAVEAAEATAEAEREATKAAPLPADRAAKIVLCKQRKTACREWSQFQ